MYSARKIEDIEKTLSDTELVIACQRGDHRAFDLLVKRHERFVFSLLHRIAPDWTEQHEDMCQEVFLRVYCSINKLRNPAVFKTWLSRIVMHLFRDELRKRPSVATLSLDLGIGEDEDSVSYEIPDVRDLPDENYERQEIVKQVTAAIEVLPEEFKNVILLREFHGLAYDEIARLTNIEVGTVKSRISRARAKIQARLIQNNFAA